MKLSTPAVAVYILCKILASNPGHGGWEELAWYPLYMYVHASTFPSYLPLLQNSLYDMILVQHGLAKPKQRQI